MTVSTGGHPPWTRLIRAEASPQRGIPVGFSSCNHLPASKSEIFGSNSPPSPATKCAFPSPRAPPLTARLRAFSVRATIMSLDAVRVRSNFSFPPGACLGSTASRFVVRTCPSKLFFCCSDEFFLPPYYSPWKRARPQGDQPPPRMGMYFLFYPPSRRKSFCAESTRSRPPLFCPIAHLRPPISGVFFSARSSPTPLL